MRPLRPLFIAVLALLTLGAAGTAVANAEDGKQPALLLLEGSVLQLEGKFKAGAHTLATLAGKTITITADEATWKGCLHLEGNEKDTNLCHEVVVDLTGYKQGKVTCRSEMANGEEKDPIETVLEIVDIHIGSEETLPGKILEPVILLKVLGALESEAGEELTINCGGVKDKIKGVLPCLLLPGLENIPITKEVEARCALNASNDQETGMCELLCEWLKEHPFEANLGAGFEDSGMSLVAKGKFNKDMFLDD